MRRAATALVGAAAATPIADRPRVDDRRAEVGLGPLAEYYAELEEACAAEAEPGS